MSEQAPGPRPRPRPRPAVPDETSAAPDETPAPADATAPGEGTQPAPVAGVDAAASDSAAPDAPAAPDEPAHDEPAPADAAVPGEGTQPAPVAGVDAAGSDSAAHDGTARARRATLLAWLPAAVLAAVAIVLLVLGLTVAGLSWKLTERHGPDTAQRQEQVLAAAKSCLATLNSFDYTRIDANLAADRACLTGSFTRTFVTGFDKTVGRYAPNEKASQTVQVNQAGVQTVNPAGTTWVVLLYGQTNTVKTGTSSSSPDIAPFGALVTMKLVGTRWLVSYYTADTHDLTG